MYIKVTKINKYNDAIAEKLADGMGVDLESDTHIYNGDKLGKDAVAKNGIPKYGNAVHDGEFGDIAINVGENGADLADGSNVAGILAEEIKHEEQRQAGQEYDSTDGVNGESEKWGEFTKDAVAGAWDRENAYNGNVTGKAGSETQKDWVVRNAGNETVAAGTEVVKGIEQAEADFIYELDPDAAAGNGHLGSYFQDEAGQWHSYNQGAIIDGQVSNVDLFLNKGFKEGINIEKVSFTKEDIAQIKNNKNHIYIETSKEQDGNLAKKAFELKETLGQRKYRLWTNSCVDSTQELSKAGDLLTPLDVDPRPNKYFEKLKKLQNLNDHSLVPRFSVQLK